MKNKRGFTLIEILIALVIMLVGILGIVVLFPFAIKNTADASRDTEIGFAASTIKTALEQAMRSTAPGEPVNLVLNGLPQGRMKFPLPKPPQDPNSSGKFYMFPPANVHYPPGGQAVTEQPPAGEGENFEGTSSDKKVYSPCAPGAKNETRDYLKSVDEEDRGSKGGGQNTQTHRGSKGGGQNTQTQRDDIESKYPEICGYSFAFDVQRPEQLPYYNFRIKVYANYENQKKVLSDNKIEFETFWIILSSNGD